MCMLHLFSATAENVVYFSPAACAWPAETRLPDRAERGTRNQEWRRKKSL
jgi:hypothetical protein